MPGLHLRFVSDNHHHEQNNKYRLHRGACAFIVPDIFRLCQMQNPNEIDALLPPGPLFIEPKGLLLNTESYDPNDTVAY